MRKIVFLVSLFVFKIGYTQEGLSTKEFEQRINTQQIQILDVRTATEFQSGHLKNALQADWLIMSQFTDRVKYLDKTKPLLVYCASGVRSASAAKWLLANGFVDVKNLKSGLVSWKMEGKPVEALNNKGQLSIAKYKELIASDNKVLVDFGAEWCPPCKKMEPVLKQLQTQMSGQFKLVKVDGGIDMDVMTMQKVETLPVFIIYKNGKEVWRKQGVVELSELKAQLK